MSDLNQLMVPVSVLFSRDNLQIVQRSLTRCKHSTGAAEHYSRPFRKRVAAEAATRL